MVQLVCKCLNVGIHCKESQSISLSTTPPTLTTTTADDDNHYVGLSSDQMDDQFFKETQTMTLALAGITMEHEYLCWPRIVGQEWAINHCCICGTDTHATHINNDNQRRLLVNIHLESNASRIESLRLSENYSPVFRVILPVKFDNQLAAETCHPVLTLQASIEANKRSLQQRVQRFLSEEQKLMEERIRTFTEQEHNRFAEMQLTIGRNEETLYNILEDIHHKISGDQNLDQSLAFAAQQLHIDANAVDEDLGLDSYLNIKSTQSIAKAQPLDNNKQKKSQPLRYRSQSVDYESVGGIFDIDVDVDDGNAFDSISYSDEEEDDSIAFRNSNNEYNYNNGRAVPNAQMNAQNNGLMAYSLPIQVQIPKWKTFHNYRHDIDEEDVPMNRREETIAESIKKLAKSVRNESDIFGDRPRRRLNTGDLIKSRPI